MTAVNQAMVSQARRSSENARRRERRFFTGMAVAAMAAIFVGFAPSYYLKGIYGAPALPPLVHLHVILFTTWIAMFVAQTSLVAARRTDLHRRLGIGGAVLAALMTVVAFATAIGSVRRGSIDLAFLTIPIASVVVF